MWVGMRVGLQQAATEPQSVQAEVTNKTNYFATKDVCTALVPLLAAGARVVNVASRAGTMTMKGLSPEVQAKFAGATGPKDLDALVTEYIQRAKDGTITQGGFRESAYGTSKLALIALSEIMGKGLAGDSSRPGILANSCCPGYVDTDMTSHKGNLTPDQGADTIVWLALLPPNDPNNPSAKFVAERKIIDWRKGQTREEAALSSQR